MWETRGSVFRLESCALHRLPSHSFVFTFCFPSFNFFFLWRYLKWKLLVSLLTWLRISVIIFFLRNTRNAVSILAILQACNFFYILQHGCKFSSWLIVNNLIWYFVLLHSATEFESMLQDTCELNVWKGPIALYQYKVFKVIPLKLFYYQTFFKNWHNQHSWYEH